MWNKDEVRGKADEMKGRAKQAVGDLTNDDQQRAEGVADEIAGHVEKGVGTARRKAGEALENLGKTIKK